MVVKNDSESRNTCRAQKILDQIEARQLVNNRTVETRKKILLGALLIKLISLGKIDEETINQELNAFLIRANDRQLFGLERELSRSESKPDQIKPLA